MGAFWDQGMVSHHGEGRAGKGPSSALGAALCSPREELLGLEVGLWDGSQVLRGSGAGESQDA